MIWHAAHWAHWVRAFVTLVLLSFRRLFWSVGTLMLLFPLGACTIFLLRRRYDAMSDPAQAFNSLSNFVLIVYAAFLVPLCALAFGTASVGGDREDKTLLFLLIRPLPRAMILLAKFAAALPLVLGFSCGAFWIYCRLAGEAGRTAYDAYLPAAVYMSIAYTAVFHLFAVWFRHSTIAALIYAVFMEVLLGNVPGIIKRVAINYYGRSLMYDAGVEHGLSAPDPQWFEPIEPGEARMALWLITVGALLVAWLVFRTREYEEPT